MPRTFSTHVAIPPTDWLKEVQGGKMPVTGINVWKALRHPSFVQIINRAGQIVNEASKILGQSGEPSTKIPKLDQVAEFRLTRRAQDFLEEHESTILAFKKNDPPPNIRHWLSSFRRLARNCPEGIELTYAGGELRVLAKDTRGKTKNDDLHLVESVKVPWLSI